MAATRKQNQTYDAGVEQPILQIEYELNILALLITLHLNAVILVSGSRIVKSGNLKKIQQYSPHFEWAFARANYLPLIFSTKEVLILSVSKHRHKDNNIYERDHKNGKAACGYKHFTQ